MEVAAQAAEVTRLTILTFDLPWSAWTPTRLLSHLKVGSDLEWT